MTLDPNYAAAHQWLGELLLINGRVADGTTHLKRASELDPLSPITFGSYALSLAVARQPDAAITAGRRAVELDSTLLVTRFMLGTALLQAGKYPEATKELENALRLDPTSVQTMGLLGYGYAKTGNTKRATDMAKSLEGNIGKMSGAAAGAARVYLGLGDNAKALSLLERAVADHDSFFASESLSGNFFDPIRNDPRFSAIVAKVGLDRRVLTK